MNIEPPFQLKQTNVSRPQLTHSNSKQSIAASEDYYSLTENNSSESDDRSKPTPSHRYQTPPSRQRSPTQSHEHLQQHPEKPVTSLKGLGKARSHPQPSQPTTDLPNTRLQSPVSTILEEDSSQRRHTMDSESLATTPGMDNTPYIRFAIDQLTRDEEVRGSRLYPQVSAAEDDYPVERIVSDDGLGYMQQEQERERRMSRQPPARPQRESPSPNSLVGQDAFVPYSYQHAPLNFIPGILRPLWLGIYIFLCLLMLAGLIFSAVYSNRNGGIGLWDYVAFGDNRYFVFEYLPILFGMIILVWSFQVQIALQRVIPFASMTSESTRQRSQAIFLQLYPTQFLLPKLEHFRAGSPVFGTCYVIFWLFNWTIPLLASSFNVRYDLATSAWRWIAVQGVIWIVIVLYILLIFVLFALLFLLSRRETGLKWDPRSLADILALLERSNIMNDYNGSETFTNQHDFKERLANRADRLGYWHMKNRPSDIFYGMGEEGGAPRRFSVEQGKIREKGAYPPRDSRQEQSPGDFSIRMDIRSSKVRLRYLPWYLRVTSVIAWILIAIILLIAFLVISFLNSAVRDGFLPQLSAHTNSAGFSPSNFLYSFIPALIGQILFLVILTFDYSIRGLQPYVALSSRGGSTAEASLLVDYSSRLPISATISALENRHFQSAALSFVSFCSTTIPVLAGGCFWTQYYPDNTTVRVAADPSGFYALCFFLALYAVTLFALVPNRRRAALPHRSNTVAEIISWVYQSPILADRAFNRPQTKAELVTRLMGSEYLDRTFMQSVTNLIRPSRDNLRNQEESRGRHIPDQTEKIRSKGRDRDIDPAKRNSLLDPATIKYGFGIHVGRDGLEHLGIERTKRGGDRSGRELVIWEEQRRKSWAENV